jgi:hypothetical protein
MKRMTPHVVSRARLGWQPLAAGHGCWRSSSSCLFVRRARLWHRGLLARKRSSDLQDRVNSRGLRGGGAGETNLFVVDWVE